MEKNNNNKFSSIFHKQFDRLYDLTKCYRKTTLLDKLIYWWQISTYKLEDGNIWFTRSLPEIAEGSKIPVRSVSRYLAYLEKQGYIERRNKLFIKKHLYIRITQKLLNYLTLEANKESNSAGEERLNLNQDGGIRSANLANSIYKDQDNNSVVNSTSTVSVSLFVDKVKTPNPPSSLYPSYPIEQLIGEQLSEKEKNYIKGMMHRLQRQDGLAISYPEQLFAEIVFSVLNPQQLKGVTEFQHKVQIIAKLIRTRVWKTPKGFYNHSDYGAYFKNKESESKPFKQTSAVGDAFELKKQRDRLDQLLKEQLNTINSQTKFLEDKSVGLIQDPGSVTVINTLVKSLSEAYAHQIKGCMELEELDVLLHSKRFISYEEQAKEYLARLNYMRFLADKLQTLEQLSFELFCQASKAKCLPSDLDPLYFYYEDFSKLGKQIEHMIDAKREGEGSKISHAA